MRKKDNIQIKRKLIQLRLDRLIWGSLIGLGLSIPGHAQQEEEREEIEEIVVVADFRRNLEDALSTKRNASTIVDAISSDDISTLPALDLGEALQSIPGVQLNREGERRESSINLRGLPSGFTLATVNGQTVASPGRSSSVFGAPNPFGAYDAAVFNGINVVKATSADLQEGGIAGIVDQRLIGALDAPEFSLNIGTALRFEELADEVNPEFVIKGSKHFNDSRFAVAGTLAWSEQDFRRDEIRINRYDTLTARRFDEVNAGQSLEQFRLSQGIPEGAVLQIPGELRQTTETNGGDRLSFSGGVEWQINDEFKLGANVLYTSRDQDDNGFDQIDFRPRQSNLITPLTGARNTGVLDGDGNQIFSVSDIELRDTRVGFDSREFDILSEAQSIVLDGEWQNDVWKVDSSLTFSESQATFDEVLLAFRFLESRGSEPINPLVARLSTGEGNISDFVFDLFSTDPNFTNLDTIVFNDPQLVLRNTSVVSSSPNDAFPRQRTLGVTGTFENIDQDTEAFDLNVERSLDGFVSAVKVGYRYSKEDADSVRVRQSTIGIDANQAVSNSILTDTIASQGGTFFGGEAPGAPAQLISFNPVSFSEILTSTIPDISQIGFSANGEAPFFTNRGFIQRGGQQGAGLVYDTSLETHAAYVKVDFEKDWFRGNVGLRYVESDLVAGAPLFDLNNLSNTSRLETENDYDFLLPSVNLAFDLSENLIMRLGYSEGIVRPNLRNATPASTISVGGTFMADGAGSQNVRVGLPAAGVDPFDADSYDFSVEWYNREGSAITFAAFKKDVNNLFERQSICDDSVIQGLGFSSLVGSVGIVDGTCITSGVAGSLEAGSDVSITQIRNVASEINVEGFEVSIQQNLDFLPYPWDGFGGVINYSNTSQDSDSDITIPGISDDTYNAIIYYERDSFGVRLAYNYRTEYDLESTGTLFGESRSVRSAGRLDLSAYYNVNDRLKVGFRAFNILDTLQEQFEEVEFQPRSTTYDGRVFTFSANYSF